VTVEVTDARAASPEVVAPLVDNFITLMRAFNKARARIVAAAEHDVEWSAHLLLRSIANSDEPMRAGALAECLHSDPSTVSRQVAALVKDGYLERHADPDDGRASLLVLTDRAKDLLVEHDQIRLEHFARVVGDWSDADLKRFAGMLERFTKAYEAATTNWIVEAGPARPGRAGSKH
jgi:DNA-binding MarR family transcriptional regulator